MNLDQFRSYFDEKFLAFLDTKVDIFLKDSTSTEISIIGAYIKKIAQGGKRFRPYLTYLCINTDEPDVHLQLFFSIELLHIFALVHDDVMDEGVMRHGVECAHIFFGKKYHNERVGKGVAILLGDLMYAWSHESLCAYTDLHPQKKDQVVAIFAELVREVIHGQMLDVIFPEQNNSNKDLIMQKMYLKTARYSFIQPMRIGFTVADAPTEKFFFAQEYGRALGLAFQLQDDLIDLMGGNEKSTFLDIETKQHTLLHWFMQHKADSAFLKRWELYFGKKLTEDDKKEVVNICEQSGAFAYVKQAIDEYYKEATSLTSEAVWQELVSTILKYRK